ncbi:MAG: phosphate signaling complex protein PhoU [Deltaproteobacteria bacterium]|nr:phosphate signaling complex protein PhoU [Deltaproteobacteria bacterium]MBI3386712.1 phosphate signaling complex protein PhoU [Deltaproteobacteria bacterium]
MEARQHSDPQYEAELNELHLKILGMGGLVEKQIANAIAALVNRDDEQARVTIAADHTVNRLDVEIDDLCIRLLALHQPAARDLRLITTGLKITTDLERIGDMAVNICERALELNQEAQLKPLIDIPRMAEIAGTMLRESLDAFVREDVDLALKVCREDDVIDLLTEQLFRELSSFMIESPQTITRAIRLLFIAKYLERIADHATNIAEMVVFMVKGKSIRHLDQVPPSV